MEPTLLQQDGAAGAVRAATEEAGIHRARDARDVADAVADAGLRHFRWRIRAGGSWMHAGRPTTTDRVLDVSALSGIIEYVPGDLTLTALAGTPLAEIDAVTGNEGQWLALDPSGAGGSLGATVATATAGPLAHGLGVPRDVVLGLEVVTGAGAVVRTGGKVVKNVAGFDLTRLFTGSWGTLCVITEVTVRLRALPEVDETVALPFDVRKEGRGLAEWLKAVRAASTAPMALELVSSALAAALGVGDGACLLARVGGNASDVRAQRAALAHVGELRHVDTGVWDRLRRCEPERASVIRLSRAPSRMAETWSAARALTRHRPDALLHATVGRGVVRCVIPDDGDGGGGDLLRDAARFDGRHVLERLPVRWWDGVTGSVISNRLSRSIKDGFDPMHILNPGLLGDAA
ncbi:MAG: FAD-binding oxidoreductase [Gemmatimonadaceae bacterium]